MESPFAGVQVPHARTFGQRLWRRPDPQQAGLAVAALFSETDPTQVTSTAVSEALLRYGVTGSEARQVLNDVWSDALGAFLADDVLTDEEVSYLERLVYLFDFDCDRVDHLKAALIHPRFQQAVAAVLEDDVVTDDERASLTALGGALRMESTRAEELLQDAIRSHLSDGLSSALADGRLSPSEWQNWITGAKNVGVNPSLDEATQAAISRARTLWEIENGQLPQTHADIKLLRGEVCHLVTPAEWYEMRTRTTRITYGGPVASIRIAKGLRYRVGSIAPAVSRRDELTRLAGGTLYVTNKRVVLDGDARNFAVRLRALIGIEVFSDGLVLEKATGKNPHLLDIRDPEYAGAVLTAALAAA